MKSMKFDRTRPWLSDASLFASLGLPRRRKSEECRLKSGRNVRERQVRRMIRHFILVGCLLASAGWSIGTAKADAMAQTTDNLVGGLCSNIGATAATCSTSTYSSAKADLATGVLAARANGYDPILNVTSATGRAQYSDAITLVLPQNYSGTVVPVALGFTVDNAVLGTNSAIEDQLVVTGKGVANGCQATAPSQFCGVNPPLDNTPLDLSLAFDVSTTSLTVDFTAFLYAQAAGAGSGADAFDPGQLSISLPPGVTFTSASGVLLTAAPAPAPMIGAGLPAFVLVGGGLLLARLGRRKAGGVE
jgi:hypothetical protein